MKKKIKEYLLKKIRCGAYIELRKEERVLNR